ncbi:MAG: GGDEF domain-containing protein [Candidatus Nanopelagicales bacterium]
MGTSHDHRRLYRREVGKRETPIILLYAGLIVLVLPVLNYVIPPRGAWYEYVITAVVGLAFCLLSLAMRRPGFPAGAVPWVFASCTVGLIGLLLLTYLWDPRVVNLVWITGVLLAFGPGTEAPAPFFVAASVGLVSFAVALVAWSVPDAADWLLVAVASLVISYVLLRRRLRTLDELADAHAASEQQAMTDPLTGLLNRRGLTAQLGVVAATAQRYGDSLFVVFVDVRGLKAANDAHGHDFGDEVLAAAARALRRQVRQGDLVARWGGDEFVVVGLGAAPAPARLEQLLQDAVREQGPDPERWSGRMSVGLAAAGPSVPAVLEAVARADADMYRRRGAADVGAADPA